MYVRDKNIGAFSSKSTEDPSSHTVPYVLGEETRGGRGEPFQYFHFPSFVDE